MSTVNEWWLLTDIPAAIQVTSGFGEKFQMILQAMMLPLPPPPAPVSAATMAVMQVLMSAWNHQNNASTFHLGKTTTLPPSNHNLLKANSVLKEWQHACTIAQKGDHMITVIASLWRVKGSLKEQLVHLIQQLSHSTALMPV